MKDPLNGIEKVQLLTTFEKIFAREYERLLKHPKSEKLAPYKKSSTVLGKVALVRAANRIAGFLPDYIRVLLDTQLVSLDEDEPEPKVKPPKA